MSRLDDDRTAGRIARELLEKPVVSDRLEDEIRSDETFVHLAVALERARFAESCDPSVNVPDKRLRAVEDDLETLARRELRSIEAGMLVDELEEVEA